MVGMQVAFKCKLYFSFFCEFCLKVTTTQQIFHLRDCVLRLGLSWQTTASLLTEAVLALPHGHNGVSELMLGSNAKQWSCMAK